MSPTPQICPPNPFDDPTIARLLANYDIRGAADWKCIGKWARLGLPGVTPQLIRDLDALADGTGVGGSPDP